MEHIIFSKLKNIRLFYFQTYSFYSNVGYGHEHINRLKTPYNSTGNGECPTHIQNFIPSDGYGYGLHNGNGRGNSPESYGTFIDGDGDGGSIMLSLENNKED